MDDYRGCGSRLPPTIGMEARYWHSFSSNVETKSQLQRTWSRLLLAMRRVVKR